MGDWNIKEYTVEELASHDGKNGAKIYVAYRGKVYDLTDSYLWETGVHQELHEAGLDLSEAFDQEAPHGPEVFEGYPVVGSLKTGPKFGAR